MSSKRLKSEEIEDSKPPAKKACSRKNNNDNDDIGGNLSLPLDALSCVMEFLPPRDLFHTAFTCKSLRDTVTTRMVVQSAIMYEGNAKKSVEELYKLTKAEACYIPSPMRLLRLCNGKMCEVCNQNKVKFVRPWSLGIFACWICITEGGLTKAWNTKWVRYNKNRLKYDAIFNHSRVANNQYGSKNYMSFEHFKDETGEKIGPVVTFGDVDNMVAHPQGIDDYITNVLDAPKSKDYKTFNDTYETLENLAQQAEKERCEKIIAKSKQATENKMAKVEKMLGQLSRLIDEPYREAVMKRRNTGQSMPCIEMWISFVDAYLRPYILSPSKIRKKILAEIAENINGKLHVIEEKNFTSFDFLSEEDLFEGALKERAKSKYPDTNALFNGMREASTILCGRASIVDDRFIWLLQQDDFVGALIHIEKIEGNDVFACLLLSKLKEEESYSRLSSSSALANPAIQRDFAETVWLKEREKHSSLQKYFRCSLVATERETPNSKDPQIYKRAFSASYDRMKKLWQALIEYEVWLKRNNTHSDVSVSREQVIFKTLKFAYKDRRSHSDLLEGKFESLHEHHCKIWNKEHCRFMNL